MKGFTYEQKSGEFAIVNGDWFMPFLVGFAGTGAGRNNPELQYARNVGPLPIGKYRMRVCPHPRFQAPAIRLDAFEENDMRGRSGFWIHGGSHSEGCIVLDRVSRRSIEGLLHLGFDTLRVI